jgi:hypothetical protein
MQQSEASVYTFSPSLPACHAKWGYRARQTEAPAGAVKRWSEEINNKTEFLLLTSRQIFINRCSSSSAFNKLEIGSSVVHMHDGYCCYQRDAKLKKENKQCCCLVKSLCVWGSRVNISESQWGEKKEEAQVRKERELLEEKIICREHFFFLSFCPLLAEGKEWKGKKEGYITKIPEKEKCSYKNILYLL